MATSMSITPPQCEICLDLEWGRMEEDSGDGDWHRRIKVPYQSLRGSKTCQICVAITSAISEFGKPLKACDQGFDELLEMSDIRIFVQDMWTVLVLVWMGDEFPEPYFEFEMFVSKECTPHIPAFRHVAQIPPTLDLLACTRFLEPQIRKCDLSHTRCQSDSTQMPSRLVFVGSKGDVVRPRLENRPSSQPYIALSHCWGDQKAILRTTKANIEELIIDIPWTNLPKTFQDAVTITRALEIGYLWIDSLCIVQDDRLDWKTESAKMADIYAGAHLTIAATGASSATAGCFFARWHEPKFGVQITHAEAQYQSDRVTSIQGIKVRYNSRAHTQFTGSLHPPMKGAPLWTRAWAFQERILSNRIIHFHAEEMVWECRESQECECGYLAWDRARGTTTTTRFLAREGFTRAEKHKNPLETYNTWLQLVQEFTKLDISSELDRFPAICGIATSLQPSMKADYIAGVWSDRIGQGLFWKKRSYQRSRRTHSTPDHYVPTWSWASVELLHPDKCFGLDFYPKNITIDEHLIVNISASPGRRIRSILTVQDAELTIKGLAILCVLKHIHYRMDVYANHSVQFKEDSAEAYTDITCEDEHHEDTQDEVVICVLLGRNERKQYGLVLQADEANHDNYKRVGVFELESQRSWFDQAEVKSFTVL